MAGRGLSSNDVKLITLDAEVISSMTVRMYCTCGDAVIVDGSPIWIQEAVTDFSLRHTTPKCAPCGSKTAARARAKRGRMANVSTAGGEE